MTSWSDPGIEEVAPGVHRIPLPLPGDGLRAVNVYAVHSGLDLVLVDGGWALTESEELLGRALKTLGAGLADISRFLVTHIHRDHYTQAIAVRRRFGTHVALGVGETAGMTAVRRGRPIERHVGRLRAAGAAALADRLMAAGIYDDEDMSYYEPPDQWLADDDRVEAAGRLLEVHPTPGHTRGHVVFADRDAGLLFSGDHVLPHITPSIGFEPAPDELPLRGYLDSLRLVRRLPDLRLLPAHGPVVDSAHARIDELLDHHGHRLDLCAQAVEAGAATGYEVAQRLGWTRRQRRLDELDPFNQMLAVLEAGVHLDLLAAQGRLTANEEAGVIHYTP